MMTGRPRESVFEPEFRSDLQYWAKNDRKIVIKIFDLIEAVMRDPFNGIGKPEPLRHETSGTWSRRISKEHRLVYRVGDEQINFVQGRYHY